MLVSRNSSLLFVQLQACHLSYFYPPFGDLLLWATSVALAGSRTCYVVLAYKKILAVTMLLSHVWVCSYAKMHMLNVWTTFGDELLIV